MASESLELFSISFLQTLLHETIDKNIFYSPLSIVAAFSMLMLGTKDKSTDQLKNVLKYNKSLNDIHNELSTLIEKCITPLSQYDDTVLSIANGLFTQKNFHIKSEFKTDLQKYYKSEMKEVDFSSPSTVKEVNQWIENKTKDKIKDMFSENSFSHLTKLVLANAVYFKGSFKDHFPTNNTIEKDFHRSSTAIKTVKMMQKYNDDHDFAEDPKLGLKVISIPFQNYKLKFLLFLPTTRFHLDDALSKLKDNDLIRLIKSMGLRKVSRLEVPKFKIETQMDLKQLMSLLGATDVFDSQKANLKGICDEDLYVDKAIHKTFLDVNENGVEAAAATAMSISLMSMPFYLDDTPIEFIVNEPFLLSVYNVEVDAIVFLGRINDP